MGDPANLNVFLMNNYSDSETINAGTGKKLTIKQVAEKIANVIGYTEKIKWDASKPNGTLKRLLDVRQGSKAGLDIQAKLEERLKLTYHDFLNKPIRCER